MHWWKFFYVYVIYRLFVFVTIKVPTELERFKLMLIEKEGSIPWWNAFWVCSIPDGCLNTHSFCIDLPSLLPSTKEIAEILYYERIVVVVLSGVAVVLFEWGWAKISRCAKWRVLVAGNSALSLLIRPSCAVLYCSCFSTWRFLTAVPSNLFLLTFKMVIGLFFALLCYLYSTHPFIPSHLNQIDAEILTLIENDPLLLYRLSDHAVIEISRLLLAQHRINKPLLSRLFHSRITLLGINERLKIC
jgi:hypothetical protein